MEIKLLELGSKNKNGLIFSKEAFDEYINKANKPLDVNITDKNRIGVVTHISRKEDAIFGNYVPLETDATTILHDLCKKGIIEIVPQIEVLEKDENNIINKFKINTFAIIKGFGNKPKNKKKKKSTDNGATS